MSRSPLPGLGALARLARRDAAASKGRSLLVALLVAVPIGGLVAVLVAFASTDPRPEARATALLGQADLLVTTQEEVLDLDAVQATLPPGSRIEPLTYGSAAFDTGSERLRVAVTGADLTGMAAGILDLTAGRAPAADDEVALSPSALASLGASLGDRLGVDVLDDPATQTEVAVVGVVRDPQRLSAPVAVLTPYAIGRISSGLVTLPDGSVADPVRLEQAGVSVNDRASAARRGGRETSLIFVFAALALVEAALVAGAAFAVSVRRRQHELGLLAASGASPAQVGATVLLSGVTSGLAGALTGGVLALVALTAGRPLLQSWSDRLVPTVVVPWGQVLGAITLGVVTAVVAAALPALSVARLPVLVSLGGRRPPPTPSRRWLLAGAALIAGGVATLIRAAGVTSLIVGSTLVTLGFGAMSPWAIEQLGRLAPRAPLGLRLALRDTARFRTRNGPIVTALLASLALSVAVGAGLAARQAQVTDGYEPFAATDQLFVDGVRAGDAAATMIAELPVASAGSWRFATTPVLTDQPDALGASLAIGDADVVAALGGDDDALAAFEGGSAIAGGGGTNEADIRLRWSLPDTLLLHLLDNPSLLVPPVVSAATAAGLEAVPDGPESWVIRLDGPVTAAQASIAQAAASRTANASVFRETGPGSVGGMIRAVLAVSVVTSLIVVAVSLALAATEARDDERTLAAVGAEPRVRRSVAAGRAAVLAGLGGLLAVPAGLIPVWGATRFTGLPFVIPLPVLAVVALGVPLLAVAGAWSLTRPAARWLAYR